MEYFVVSVLVCSVVVYSPGYTVFVPYTLYGGSKVKYVGTAVKLETVKVLSPRAPGLPIHGSPSGTREQTTDCLVLVILVFTLNSIELVSLLRLVRFGKYQVPST